LVMVKDPLIDFEEVVVGIRSLGSIPRPVTGSMKLNRCSVGILQPARETQVSTFVEVKTSFLQCFGAYSTPVGGLRCGRVG